ncbi:MAG: hypothetical protein EP329_23905 [Deltaproteobacteria bacterium]|nr:MAG: hypothetical protein EP329_23905 [Deltaproteobacteria bacterium]
MNTPLPTLLVAATLALAACKAPAPDARGFDGPGLALTIAPLDLPGVTDARYQIRVANSAAETVWEREVLSSAYGDGGGSVSYVGPCDADLNPNAVTVTLLELSDAAGVIDPATWVHPPPLTRTAVCQANVDVPVVFDLTVARAANQGFFDVAVTFDDIFCSAKLDCGPTTAPEDDIKLLHDPSGVRATTAVLGLACTADPDTVATTRLYLDDLRITCVGSGNTTVVVPTGAGRLDLSVAPNANPDGYLFGASVFQGWESMANKLYWNVALGLDRDAFAAAGACTLTTTATASNGPFPGDGLSTPAASIYPVIVWDVLLSDAGGRRCTNHPLNGAPAGVATVYTDGVSAHGFDHALPATAVLESAATLPGGAATFSSTSYLLDLTVGIPAAGDATGGDGPTGTFGPVTGQ